MNNVILLVEDNPTDEKLTLRAFQKSNVDSQLEVVRDGAEAIRYLCGPPAPGAALRPLPAVVLLDLNLPLVSGLDVLQRIRTAERTKLLPVVILTASREEEDIVNGYSFGANAYVRKPVDFAEFVQAARTVGLFWVRLNERAALGVH